MPSAEPWQYPLFAFTINGFEYRREVARRRVDDLDHLGHRRLSRERSVTVGGARLKLSGALGKLTPKISYDPLRIGQCAIRRRAHLRTSSDRPSGRIIPCST